MQPRPGRAPVLLHGPARDLQRLCGFAFAHAAEEAELDKARGPWVDDLEPPQRVIQFFNVNRVSAGDEDRRIERHLGRAAAAARNVCRSESAHRFIVANFRNTS